MLSQVHRELGLSDKEAGEIERLLGRSPNHLELAMYAVMWSEHCSYKSSKVHLSRLPTEGKEVLVGPGENAGVIDAGDGLALALRIESHNHPSAIEPYQGAATGVGGILRDIFTMGARPIAIMDPLRFGDPDDPRSRWIASGVVAGISGYGNSVGVPTVGGEIDFDPTYSGNPLVNVLCCGLLPAERLVLGRASGTGNLAVLLGAPTGRDGIGGVSVLASAGFSEVALVEESKRPKVQVGDPFEEKRLIEACLQLLDEKVVVGIQDLGGAGLTCATSETASRGGVGMDVNVRAVPRREPDMAPWEVMTSESQERMLAIVEPGALDRVLATCEKWEVQVAVVGRVTDSGRLRVLEDWEGSVLADVPAVTLGDGAPVYHRPMEEPAQISAWREDPAGALETPKSCALDLVQMLVDPSWVYRQYDHQLFLNTVISPGADAALLRLEAPGVTDGQAFNPRPRAFALSTDGNGRWCSLDPRRGAALVVAESALNVACVGARPVAVVNCLNFGNPEHPAVMWQLSEAVDGIGEACRALGLPVIGGNVSLYNESGGRDIDPTPVVGTVGLTGELEVRPPGAELVAGQAIVLIGPGRVSLAGSRWAERVKGHRGGVLPDVDWELHKRLIRLLCDLIPRGWLGGVHDVSDGGLGVALAEMGVKAGVGFDVTGVSDHEALFGEGPSRVLLSVDQPRLEALRALVEGAGIEARILGGAGGRRLRFAGLVDLDLADATSAWSAALPALLGGARAR